MLFAHLTMKQILQTALRTVVLLKYTLNYVGFGFWYTENQCIVLSGWVAD